MTACGHIVVSTNSGNYSSSFAGSSCVRALQSLRGKRPKCGDRGASDMTGRSVAGWGLWMGWVLRLVETGIDSPPRVIDVMDIKPLGDLGDIAKLGLTLSEAKQILARLQQAVVAVQADDHAALRPDCSSCGQACHVKDWRLHRVATLFGHCAGAPPAISLRRLWPWRDRHQLAVILPIHTRARPTASTCFCSDAVSRRRWLAGAPLAGRDRNEPRDVARPYA